MSKPTALYYSSLNYTEINFSKIRDFFEVFVEPAPSFIDSNRYSHVNVIFAPLGFKFDEQFLDSFRNLKAICSNTTGIPHIDLDYCHSKGISVIALHDQQAFLDTITPTAEMAVALALVLQRNIIAASCDVVQNSRWRRRNFGGEKMLSRQTVGLVGMGRIGRMVHKIYSAFGSEVIYYDPYVPGGVSSINDLFSKSDIISVHCVSNPETKHLISQNQFVRMKRGSILVNTARAEVIKEADLLLALQSGSLAGVATDVLDGEYAEGFEMTLDSNPLVRYARSNRNLLITPHIGGSTRDAWLETEGHVIDRVCHLF